MTGQAKGNDVLTNERLEEMRRHYASTAYIGMEDIVWLIDSELSRRNDGTSGVVKAVAWRWPYGGGVKYSGENDGFQYTGNALMAPSHAEPLCLAAPIQPVTNGVEGIGPVTREDAIDFLEVAGRNWENFPPLSEEDIGDVASALLRFASKRLPSTPGATS